MHVVARFNADGATGRTSGAIVTQAASAGHSVPVSAEKPDTEKVDEEFIETAPDVQVHPAGQHELDGHAGSPEPEEEHFEWREVLRGVFDVQTWLTALAYMAILISLYSYSLFL